VEGIIVVVKGKMILYNDYDGYKQSNEVLNEINTFNQLGRYDNELMEFVQKCTPEYSLKYFNLIQTLYLLLKECFQESS
jgi:hypothetical protein